MFKEENAVWVGKNVIGKIERMLMHDVFVIALLPGKRLAFGDGIIDIAHEGGKTTASVRVYPFETNKVKVAVLLIDTKKNRRNFTRYSVHDCNEIFVGTREEPGYIIDISSGGIKFGYKFPLILGKRISMKVVINENVTIDATGDVVGQLMKPDGFWYNVKFTERLQDAVINMISKISS